MRTPIWTIPYEFQFHPFTLTVTKLRLPNVFQRIEIFTDFESYINDLLARLSWSGYSFLVMNDSIYFHHKFCKIHMAPVEILCLVWPLEWPRNTNFIRCIFWRIIEASLFPRYLTLKDISSIACLLDTFALCLPRWKSASAHPLRPCQSLEFDSCESALYKIKPATIALLDSQLQITAIQSSIIFHRSLFITLDT